MKFSERSVQQDWNVSLKNQIMRNQLIAAMIVTLSLGITSCRKPVESSLSGVEIILSVYNPSNPGSVKSDGDFDARDLKVYYDGKYLGVTPLEFTTEKIQELEMPSYEKVETSENSFWLTWDTDGHGRFEIAAPNSPETKRILEFRSLEDDSLVLFSGLTTQSVDDGVIKLSVQVDAQPKG